MLRQEQLKLITTATREISMQFLPPQWQQDAFNALLDILVATVTLSLGWFVGQRLTVYWGLRQKRKELELAAASRFYELYGEFFAVWKLWSYYLKQDADQQDSGNERWELLARASAAEGELEALFVKLASERTLNDRDMEVLGRFRQAYQCLRESIRDRKNLGWNVPKSVEYASFKRLAYLTACIVLDNKPTQPPIALETITSRRWVNKWTVEEAALQRLISISSAEPNEAEEKM
jgi:hypothetical protein